MASRCIPLSGGWQMPPKQHEEAHDEARRRRHSQQQQQKQGHLDRKKIQRLPQKLAQQKETEDQHQEQWEHFIPHDIKPRVDTRASARRSVDQQQANFDKQRRQDGCLMVLKIGTSTLMTEIGGEMHMSLSNVGKFVDLVCELRSLGHAVVVVSSGAVGAGCVTLHLKQRPDQLNMKQAIASVGQCRLMRLYEDLFGLREQKVAQLLISRHDLVHQKSYQNFRSSLRALLSLNVVPIINENDSLATEELRFGDNDTLAAHIAVAVEAQWLFILTDVHCLYDKNPHKHSDARPVALVDRLTDVYAFLSEKDCGGWGTGGMYTKVVASKIATNMGVHVAVAHGGHPLRVLDMYSYVAAHVEQPSCRRPLTPLLQQRSCRSSTSSPGNDDTADSADPEQHSTPRLSDGLRDNRSKSADAALAAQLQERKNTSATPAAAGEPGDNRVDSVADDRRHFCGFAAGVPPAPTDVRHAVVAAAGNPACRETPDGMHDLRDCRSEDTTRNRSCGSNDHSGNRADESSCVSRHERVTGECSAREDRGSDPCDTSSGNIADNARQSNGTINEIDSRSSSSDVEATDTCRDEVDGFPTAASCAGNVEAHAVPCEQQRNRQQQQQQKNPHAEGDALGASHGVANQQQKCCSPRGSQQEPHLHSSVMICDSLQQMPFIGTIFLANTLMPHKRDDARRWILSLPVRGKLFVDQGAVQALVQQKKSLFAAGIRHVVGNFTASECVTVYLDTCYGALSPEGSSCSEESRTRPTLKSSGTNMRRLHSRSIRKCSICCSTVNGQNRLTTCCWNGDGGKPGQANTGQGNTQPLAAHQVGDTCLTATAERLTPTHGYNFASEATRGKESCCRPMRENSPEKHAGSRKEASTPLSFPPGGRSGDGSCCSSVSCCPLELGMELHSTNGSANACSVTSTPAVSASVTDRRVACAAAADSTTASSDVNVAGDNAAGVAGRSSLSKSWPSVASVAAAASTPAGAAWGLVGPPETLEIARCISNFSSAELQVIKGKKSSEFTELLGYPVDDEVAHREYIVFTFMNGDEHLKQLCLGLACNTVTN